MSTGVTVRCYDAAGRLVRKAKGEPDGKTQSMHWSRKRVSPQRDNKQIEAM